MPWYRIPHTDQRMWFERERLDLELIEDEPAANEEPEGDEPGDV